jgi:hypothetical protein
MTLMTDVERCVALTNHLAAAQTVTLRIREDEPGGASSILRAGPGGALICGEAAAAAAGIDFVRNHSNGPAAAALQEADGGAALGAGEAAGPRGSGGASDVSGGGSSSSEEDADDDAAAGAALSVQERRRLRRVAASASKGRKLWRDVTVPVDPRLQPVYILGRSLRRKDLRRGLASCASAETLKLGTREPERLAAALGVSCGGSSKEEPVLPLAPGTPRSAGGSFSSGQLSRSSSAASASSLLSGVLSGGEDEGEGSIVGGAAEEEAPRLVVTLPDEWRQEISDKVLSRLDMISERVTVLAIGDSAGGGAAAGGGKL